MPILQNECIRCRMHSFFLLFAPSGWLLHIVSSHRLPTGHKLSGGDCMRCYSACPDGMAQIIGGPDAPRLSGQVRFFQEDGRVLVVADLKGLPETNRTGFFAFHIHAGSTCSGEGFSGTGGHYQQTGQVHPNHAGDLPVLLSCHGTAYLAVRTDRFCVRDIIGRTVVIHSGPDDFHSQPAGNAGTKIGCGVIRGREYCRRQLCR